MRVARDIKGDVGKSGREITGAESGVLFPRLHVKETTGDGPRAPPRNKMALYEQFTIPSQRLSASSHGAGNKMALYEQFTIPSNRFSQPLNDGTGQNPSMLNQPASCDGRFMYAPYYLSPHAYGNVSFPGQFLGQNLMSCNNSTATELDKSTKSDLPKSTEQSLRVASHSNARSPKVQCNQIPVSLHRKDAEDLSMQSSRKWSNSDVIDNAKIGLHLQKRGQKSNNPLISCVSEDLRTVPPQVDCPLKYPPHQSYNPVIQKKQMESREREPELCKDSSQFPDVDSYSVDEGLQKHSNERDVSRVECEDNFQSKTSSTSDNISDSRAVILRSSRREHRAFVEQSHGVKEHLKTSSAYVESQYSEENLSRDSERDIDGCEKHEQSHEKESLQDQYKSHLCNDRQSMVIVSGHQENEKDDLSDHNSDSSMVDSLHAFDVTPKSVIAAIGQKEFWRVRKAILRQQKIFSTQVFELHRLVKVQKLIATTSNLLLEDNTYETLPVCTSEEQCVPTIDPEKCPKSLSIHVHHDCEVGTDKGKPSNKEMPTHFSKPSHSSVGGSVEPVTHDTRDQSHAATFPVGTYGSCSASAWGYPAYIQNPCAVAAHPGCYGCYHQYPMNQLGVPNAVIGIPCNLEGNSIGSQNVHGCQHQCQCSAEQQAKVLGHFPKYPSSDRSCYNPTTARVPFEPFTSTVKACYPSSDAGRSMGNGPGKDTSDGSFRSDSVLKQSKQATNLSIDKSDSAYRSQESITQVSVRQDNRPHTQTEHHGLRPKSRNTVSHPFASLSEQNQNDTDKQEKRFNSLNWTLSEDAYDCQSPNQNDLNEDVVDVPDAVDIENQALSLFPMSSSNSWIYETVRDKSMSSSKEQRVQVIKAVPRAAMAASESTADILLSLQRERQQ